MRTLQYKGYSAQVEVDLDVQVLAGRVQDIKTVISFEAARVDELQRAFEEAIDDYLDDCKREGIEPERPYSGNILVRTTPATHRLVAGAAQAVGQSMNAWAERTLAEAAMRETATRHEPPGVPYDQASAVMVR